MLISSPQAWRDAFQWVLREAKLDGRILPLLTDEANERWRRLEDSLAQSQQLEFDDWPLDNVRSTRYVRIWRPN